MQSQLLLGAVVWVQSAPEFAETNTDPNWPKKSNAAASLVPSAEQVTEAQFSAGALVKFQAVPELVET